MSHGWQFADDFLWGVATSAAQIDGAAEEGGSAEQAPPKTAKNAGK